MELKRWFVFARDKNGLEYKFTKVPGYDSTKANFDELKKWVEDQGEECLAVVRLEEDLHKRLTALEDIHKQGTGAIDTPHLLHHQYAANFEGEMAERVKKLEAKVDTLEVVPCDMISCSRYPCNIPREKRHACYRMNPPDTPAKVDAPEKLCYRCGGEQRVWLPTAMWGEGVTSEICPECKGTGKQPPDTCGTCNHGWLNDAYPNTVYCHPLGPWRNNPIHKSACPHYDRRKA